jgi:hypothetical protein
MYHLLFNKALFPEEGGLKIIFYIKILKNKYRSCPPKADPPTAEKPPSAIPWGFACPPLEEIPHPPLK